MNVVRLATSGQETDWALFLQPRSPHKENKGSSTRPLTLIKFKLTTNQVYYIKIKRVANHSELFRTARNLLALSRNRDQPFQRA